MEVKETQATNPLLFSKNAALNSSSEALGAGFASFLQQTNMSIVDSLSAPKSELPVKENTKEVKNNIEDRKVEDRKVEDRNGDTKSNKTDRPSKKDAGKKAKSDEIVDDKSENTSKSEAVSAEDAVAVVQVAVAEEAPAVASDDGVSEVAETSAKIDASSGVVTTPTSDDLPNLSAEDTVVIGEKSFKLSDFAIKPDALAKLGVVNFVDASTGESYVTTGAELLKQLQAQGVVSDKGISLDGMSAVAEGEVIAPEVLADTKKVLDSVVGSEVKSETIAGAEVLTPKSSAETKANTVTKNVKNTADMTVAKNDGGKEQIAELKSLLGGELDVAISVSSKEEKIAYVATSDLLKDKTVLQEALSQAPKADVKSEKINQTTLAPTTNSSQAVNAQNAAPKSNVLNFVPMANANVQAQPIVENVAVSSSSVSGLSEISSTTLASAGTSGSEFVNSAKAENLAKANDTSFRDVYKGMSKEVVEQVKVNITKSAVKGIDKIDVSLKPEDLGRIEIKMQIKDGKLQAHIISSRPETMEILQKDVQSLEKAFNDAGFQTDEGSLSFSFHDGNQAGSGREKNNAELRNFLGDMFENEKNNELVNAESNYNWSPESGLNIRV